MEAFEGKWAQIKEDNVDAYLKACGVSFLLRKVAGTAKPSVDFKKEADGTWTFYFYSNVKNGKWNFKVGEESEETTPDGRKYMSTIIVVNGKLIHKQRAIKKGDDDSIVERWIENGELHSTFTCGGAVARTVDKRS